METFTKNSSPTSLKRLKFLSKNHNLTEPPVDIDRLGFVNWFINFINEVDKKCSEYVQSNEYILSIMMRLYAEVSNLFRYAWKELYFNAIKCNWPFSEIREQIKDTPEYRYDDYEEIMLDLFESKCDLAVTLQRLKVFQNLKDLSILEKFEGDEDIISFNTEVIRIIRKISDITQINLFCSDHLGVFTKIKAVYVMYDTDGIPCSSSVLLNPGLTEAESTEEIKLIDKFFDVIEETQEIDF